MLYQPYSVSQIDSKLLGAMHMCSLLVALWLWYNIKCS